MLADVSGSKNFMKNVNIQIKKTLRSIKQRISTDQINFKDILVGSSNQVNREIWIEKTIKTIPQNCRILDAGAGELQYKKYCTHLEYVSQDFAKYDGKGNNVGLQTQNWDNSKIDIVSDITAIPEPEASFDAIMCIEVFEHLPNPIAAIKEFSRLLKKEGILILTAPFCSLTHLAPYHFYSGFNKYFYEKHLADNGFEIEEILRNGDFFEYIAQELRRLPSIASKFTGYENNSLNKYINKLLYQLQNITSKENKSSELLCFGYHVKAKKK